MKLSFAKQISPIDLNTQKLDAIILASGYEKRSIFLLDKIDLSIVKYKFALGFNDRKLINRPINDKELSKSGFTILPADGDNQEIIFKYLADLIKQINKREIKILIDYSCMTRVWYGAILYYFSHFSIDIDSVKLFFSYSFSKFSQPKEPKPNTYLGPIPGYGNITLPQKNTALILGLGYEPNKAQGLYEYLDAHENYAFYTDPVIDKSFLEAIKTNNRFVFSNFTQNNIFNYPINNLTYTDKILTSLVLQLRRDHRVILAPLGPKPFTFLCLLLASRYDDIDVWRVSAGISGNAYDRTPIGERLICEVNLSNN